MLRPRSRWHVAVTASAICMLGLLRTSLFMLPLLSGPIEFDMWITPQWNQYTINPVTLHHSRFPSALFPLLASSEINLFITPELEQMVGSRTRFLVYFRHLEHSISTSYVFFLKYACYINLQSQRFSKMYVWHSFACFYNKRNILLYLKKTLNEQLRP